ncbi:hypothetical protein ACJJTC_015292 [Scirpophaga incertulas]
MLAPDYIDHEKVRVVRQERNDKMKFYYDGGTRNQRPLEVGEDGRMRNGNVWEKARVINKASVPRSYWLGNDMDVYITGLIFWVCPKEIHFVIIIWMILMKRFYL